MTPTDDPSDAFGADQAEVAGAVLIDKAGAA
jgi:hypothetical protein